MDSRIPKGIFAYQPVIVTSNIKYYPVRTPSCYIRTIESCNYIIEFFPVNSFYN